jgi:hypothetical protein
MGFWAGVARFFTGGTGGSIIKDGADIVERWVPSAQGKHEMAAEIDASIERGVAAARAHDAPPGNNRTWFDSLIDGLNRMVRPTVTIFLFGGIANFWELPKVGDVDPIVLAWTGTVFLFWFGGRALFKDLPGVIKYLQATKGDK